jgi:hypothetical protein
MADTVDLSVYKLIKGESDWHTKYNNLIDAIPNLKLSSGNIHYGTSSDPSTSGWQAGDIYIQIES